MYAIIENAGTDRETVVQEVNTYTAAMTYLDREYYQDEIDTGRVDVMKVLEDGRLTTEF